MTDKGGTTSAPEERERKRRKQANKLGKILSKMWALHGSEAFQEETHAKSEAGHVLDLTTLGQKIDGNRYRLGRHGWEDFARDLGGVYNRHIKKSNSKHAKIASNHLAKAKEMLGQKDKSLADIAIDFLPTETASKKRKPTEDLDARSRKRFAVKSSSDKAESGDADLSLKEREVRALGALASFVEGNGGSREQVAGFRSRVTRKPSDRRYDINFYNEQGRRFRSMVEVGRFLNLVKADRPPKRRASFRSKKKTSREKEAEKKKLRKELERLRKAHQRAVKSLDDFTNDQKESRYPMEDLALMEEETSNGKEAVTRSTCASARIPDIKGFPNVPDHCIPDLLMAWDFLCTFHRPLNLEPIPLDDFVAALTYIPPEDGHLNGDDVQAPPVYLAEAHLGLLKLLVGDRQSDDWWWAILETQETENPGMKLNLAVEEKEDENVAVIKVDLEALLTEEEDPLITNSWLASLEKMQKLPNSDGDAIQQAAKTALSVVANKWVAGYLRKALKLLKRKDGRAIKRAVFWLLNKVKEARPDLHSRSVRESRMNEIRNKVVEEGNAEMEKLGVSAPAVKTEDFVSDVESDDEDSEESDDEELGFDAGDSEKPNTKSESEMPSFAIPPRPLPTLVDFLLPPFKPHPNSEFISAFSWPQMAGAAACRILHRFKRLRNEVDDALRAVHELPQLLVSQRRARESSSASRIFTECCATYDGESPSETAKDHLCSGGAYLDLKPVQRLCILRVMIEAAYDTYRVQEVVDTNFKQRISALKALEGEERKAKSEAKKNAAAAETAAREQLAAEARNKFLEEKRAEIRIVNEGSNEFTDEFMESLTDEDIIEFDEDIKADFAALPAPESFGKIEVNKMVARMQEEAAFETHSVQVVSMKEVLQQDTEEMKQMEEQLVQLAGDNPKHEPQDRGKSRSVDRLRRNLEKAKENALALPGKRQAAILVLRDAIADGTIKVLKSALRTAKQAKLTGEDETSGGVWALDLMRDAALELDKAKQQKRVADARKDLVAKRNRCFIRNVPLGQDRFRNRFWHFDRDNHSNFWVEADYVMEEDNLGEDQRTLQRFLNLNAHKEKIFFGVEDKEEDLVGIHAGDCFRKFSRQEYHSSGAKGSFAKKNWGCHATEKSVRTLIKDLDRRGLREHELKSKLKEALEQTVESGEKQDHAQEESPEQAQVEAEKDEQNVILTSGDDKAFGKAKDAEREKARDGILMNFLDRMTSAVNHFVRVRIVANKEKAKEASVARYETGRVSGFRKRTKISELEIEANDNSGAEIGKETKEVVDCTWQAVTDRGNTVWLSGPDLLMSLCRFVRWDSKDKSYFEVDAAFHSYRNNMGRHCGRAADAPYSSSPMFFAKMMVRKEQELYSKLKNRNYSNNWGGMSGARAVWSNSMKDYTFDFRSARDGLLTLENAFFELMDGVSDKEGKDIAGGKDILENPVKRDDIELESIDSKNIHGLWNSPESRAVFYEIVNNCTTTGFLHLAFDLLCRNTTAYLSAHKLLHVKVEPKNEPSTRSTRRKNAWQQAQEEAW